MKRLILGVVMLLALAITTSCIKDEELKDLTLNVTEISGQVGDSLDVIKIVTGNDKYSVKSKDEKIAKVDIDDENIVVTAILPGKTTIIIRDDISKQEVEVQVTVQAREVKVNRTQVNFVLGEETDTTIQIISGNGSYQLDSNNKDVVTASLKDNVITLEPKTKGQATITLTDLISKETVSIEVSVNTREIVLSSTEIKVKKETSKLITIESGKGNYSVSSKDISIADATIFENEIAIFGKKAGETEIILNDDSTTGNTKTIKVVVYEPFEVGVDFEMPILLNSSFAMEIENGNGKYSLKTANENIVKAQVSSDRKFLIIEGLQKGNTTVSITDDISNQTVVLSIKVVVEQIRFEKETLSLKEGEVAAMSIFGHGKYSISSIDNTFVTAKIEGAYITVTAIKEGKTSIRVKDDISGLENQFSVEIRANIPNLLIEQNSVSLKKGETVNVNIVAGSGEYKATSGNSTVATAQVDGKVVTIKGENKGKSFIEITDAKSGQKQRVEVNVIDVIEDVRLSANEVRIAHNRSSTDVQIIAGSGSYQFQSDNISVASPTLSRGIFYIHTYHRDGVANITVKDVRTGKTATVKVIVGNVTASLSVDKQELTIQKGENETITITSGNGKYVHSVQNSNIATAVLTNNVLKITGVSKGSTQITITDSNTSQRVTVTVNVTESTPDIRLSTAAISIKLYEDSSAVSIISGSGYYTFESSDRDIAQPYYSRKVLYIYGGKQGVATVTVVDKMTGKRASVQVTVGSQPDLVLSAQYIQVMKGKTANVLVTKGSGVYEIFSPDANNGVAQAVISGNTITVRGIAKGEQTFTVTDKQTNKTQSFKTIVNEPTPTVELKLGEYHGVFGYNFEDAKITIISGSGSYEVSKVSHPQAFTAKLSGNTVIVSALYNERIEDCYIIIRDKVTGKTVKAELYMRFVVN